MTPAEAAVLIAIAASFDNRKPDETAATAWAMALDGLRFEDCRAAIVSHYRTSRDWIMPSDVIAAVKRVRTGRLEDVAPTPPPGMDPDDTGRYARWLAATRRAIADGEPVEQTAYEATRAIGELRAVLRAVPAIEAKPDKRTTEHQAGMEQARTELANRREERTRPTRHTVPVRPVDPPPPPYQPVGGSEVASPVRGAPVVSRPAQEPTP